MNYVDPSGYYSGIGEQFYYSEATQSYGGLRKRYYSYLGSDSWDVYVQNTCAKLSEWQDVTTEFFDVFENWEGINSVPDLVNAGKKIIEFDFIEMPWGGFAIFSGLKKVEKAVSSFAFAVLTPTDEIMMAGLLIWGFSSVVSGIIKLFDWS